jgi:hypothetical protein
VGYTQGTQVWFYVYLTDGINYGRGSVILEGARIALRDANSVTRAYQAIEPNFLNTN